MLLILPLVRKDRRFFVAFSQEMENRIMKKTFKDHGYESLLLFGEPAQDINRKKKMNKAV